MSELWESVGLIVLEGQHDAEAVSAALPVPSRVVARGPRRLALAATIHEGSTEASNDRRYAVFTAGAHTFVAPPGGVTTMTGEGHWQQALAEAFGEARWYGASPGAPDVRVFEAGKPPPPLSLSSSASSEDAVLDALAEHLGVDDARTYLSVPGGQSVVLEAETGRFKVD